MSSLHLPANCEQSHCWMLDQVRHLMTPMKPSVTEDAGQAHGWLAMPAAQFALVALVGTLFWGGFQKAGAGLDC